ncbi:MAG: deoxyuridine 5'-triphosphate nucleotidohydrolase [Alphaproteobacteria bacterium]|nr:deoxyuridine 5'-triphosphate nucleotidohydrolase [Alphaproteobacteria bacterium]
MNRIAEFEKVSFNEFLSAWTKIFSDTTEKQVKEIYDSIIIPYRATKGSAGYDFFSPVDFVISSGQTILLPTGIRIKIEEGWFLGVFPKSGLGFKYRLQLDNTVGIIDSDYYYSDNEGHIFVKITNDSKTLKELSVKKSQSICQGILLSFGITYSDEATGIRNGGLGSTTK